MAVTTISLPFRFITSEEIEPPYELCISTSRFVLTLLANKSSVAMSSLLSKDVVELFNITTHRLLVDELPKTVQLGLCFVLAVEITLCDIFFGNTEFSAYAVSRHLGLWKLNSKPEPGKRKNEENKTRHRNTKTKRPRNRIEITLGSARNTIYPVPAHKLEISALFLSPLYEYQRDCVLWMQRREKPTASSLVLESHSVRLNLVHDSFERECSSSHNRGGILADDAGMGKTIELLALVCVSPGRTLVVVPPHLVDQWIGETRRHTQLRVGRLSAEGVSAKQYDLLVATQGEVTRCPKAIREVDWHRVVVDEGRSLRNKNTKFFRQVRSIKTECRWILCNDSRVSRTDLEAYFLFLGYRLPESDDVDWLASQISIRRTKEEVRNELMPPRKIEKTVYVDLTEEETSVYAVLLDSCCKLLREENKTEKAQHKKTAPAVQSTLPLCQPAKHVEDRGRRTVAAKRRGRAANHRLEAFTAPEEASTAAEETLRAETERLSTDRKETRVCATDSGEKTLHLLELLYQLRLACCCGSLCTLPYHSMIDKMEEYKNEHTERAKYIEKRIERLKKNVHHECPVCFNLTTTPVVTDCGHYCCRDCFKRIMDGQRSLLCFVCRTNVTTHAIHVVRSEVSTKLERAVEVLREVSVREKTVVFSHFSPVLLELSKRMRKDGMDAELVTGRMEDRKNALARFSSGNVNVLLLSMRSASQGLDVSSATSMLILDPWCNTEWENQITGRLHRVGQIKTVTVYRFVARDTIEEEAVRLCEDGERRNEKLSTAELKKLLMR